MLRIDSHNESELTTLTVEGKLVGRWVKELEHCWQTIVDSQAPGQAPRSIRVNLSAVGFIDSEGKELLIRMRKQGAVLVPTGCFMKVIVDEIESEVAKG
jgi:ABC-type transporter Mla MlaB component